MTLVSEPDAGIGDGVLRFVEELLVRPDRWRHRRCLAGRADRCDATTRGGSSGVCRYSSGPSSSEREPPASRERLLAVYIAGLLVADRWSRQDGRRHAVPEAAAGIAEVALFGLLGASFAPPRRRDDALARDRSRHARDRPCRATGRGRSLPGCGDGLHPAVSGYSVLLGRPLKGADPCSCFPAYPALERLDEATATMATVWWRRPYRSLSRVRRCTASPPERERLNVLDDGLKRPAAFVRRSHLGQRSPEDPAAGGTSGRYGTAPSPREGGLTSPEVHLADPHR